MTSISCLSLLAAGCWFLAAGRWVLAGSDYQPPAARNQPPHISLGDVRNQRDLARALDRGLQLALVHRAGAGDAARQDLAALRHERPDQLHVLVVDVVDLVRAELADLAAPEQRAALALRLVAGLLVLALAAAGRSFLSKWHD